MENIPDVKRRIETSRVAMQHAQSERVKAAGTLLKKLSFTAEKAHGIKEADSLPGSPIKLPARVALVEKGSSSASSFWSSVMVIEDKKSAPVVSPSFSKSRTKSASKVFDEPDESSDSDSHRPINRRASLMNLLSEAKKSVSESTRKIKRSPQSSSISTPRQNYETSDSPSVLLKRGQATHQLFRVLSTLDIPSDVALMRKAIEQWREPDLTIPSAKLAPLVSVFSAKRGAALTDAFWKFRLLVLTSRKVKIQNQVEVIFRDRGIQTDSRRQFDTLIGLGKLGKILGIKFQVNCSEFFSRMKTMKRKQMEIAFLRAVIAELKKREI